MAGFDFGEFDDDESGFGSDLSPFLDVSPEVEEYVRQLTDAMRTPLAPGDPRRHHWVPQFFLRRFSSGDQIALVRIEAPDQHQIAQVIDVAVMKDLYTTIDVDVGETVAVERVLAMVDGAAVAPLERLAFGVLFPPQPRDRVNLALWLSLLYVRGPEHRRHMEAMADQMMKMQLSLIHDEESAAAHLRGEDGREPEPEVVQDLLETVAELDDLEFVPHQNQLVQNMLDSALQMAPFFLRRQWSVLKFPEPGLILTDRPLILYQNPENRSSLRGVGVANADELWLPLDRSTALVLHSEEVVGEIVLRVPPEHSVDDFNQAVVSQAGRDIYCHPDDVWRLRHLTMPKADRPIAKVSGGGWIKAATDGVNAPPVRKRHRRYRRDDADTQ